MEDDYKKIFKLIEYALHYYESLVPAPQKVDQLHGFVFRYKEETIQQAIVQKLARVITSLRSAQILMESGFFQEQAAIQRMLDEFHQDISFLCIGVYEKDITSLHQSYLKNFYQEDFSNPEDIPGTMLKRPTIPRKKIIAFLAKREAVANDNNPSRSVDVATALSKTYSGFIHAASPHIMSMYGGYPPSFHVSGMLRTPHEKSQRRDLWNYFYRSLMAFEEAAYTFEELELAEQLRQCSISLQKNYL